MKHSSPSPLTARVWLLCRLVLGFLLFFAAGKAFFMYYNRDIMAFSPALLGQVWFHGVSMDVSVSGYLVAWPWLLVWISLWWPGLPLRRLMRPYLAIVSLLLGTIIVGDAALYEFWKFKLDAAIFGYMESAEGTTNSVGLGFILSRVAGMLLWGTALYAMQSFRLPATLPRSSHRIFHSIVWALVGGLVFLGIRGGIGSSTMNVGYAYFSPHLYVNHSAVNPAFSLLSSCRKQENFGSQYNYFTESEREHLFSSLYPKDTGTLTDTLLRTSRPNILLVLMEGYGSRFVAELGGIEEVSPNVSRLIGEGVFWNHYYSNSFRTDRGTLSLLSGWTAYPSVSLMKMPGKLPSLPSISATLMEAGYEASYIYGGDINFTNLKGYLVGSGFSQLISDKDFPLLQAKESKWGANDSVATQRVIQEIAAKEGGKPWFTVFQTLSSHEPFEVPYHRLADAKLNAFAFTDHCIGQLMDSLRATPAWDNLLVILVPDHGFLYDITYENPAFFHCPMLWLGGAVAGPRTMDVWMNQSDVAATLLAQMGLPHHHFPWSRNVLGSNYTYPFVYATYPGGILFADSTGVSVYDIHANQPITQDPAPSSSRINHAKAILQTSYDQLETMGLPSALLWLPSLLPMRILYMLSDVLFLIVFHLVRYRRRLVATQLADSFPEKSPAERKRIMRRFYHFLCDLLVEDIKLLHISAEEMQRRVQFPGFRESLEEARRQGKQFCFFYLGHYGNWEWLASYALWSPPGWTCSQIYHPLKNKAADNFFLRLRTQFGGRCIAMKETLRHILTVRRQGGSECMAFIADQSPKWEAMHHWTPFLHHPTSFFIGTEKIGKQMDAAIFYVHVTRPARGHYVGQVMPITYTPGQHADYEITDTYARLLEAQIKECPELWLWTHNRWKRTHEQWLSRQQAKERQDNTPK